MAQQDSDDGKASKIAATVWQLTIAYLALDRHYSCQWASLRLSFNYTI